MSWVAVAVVGGSVIGAGASIVGSRGAAKEASRGANAATAESARQFDLIRSDTAPQRQIGVSAMDQLSRLYGFAPASGAAAMERAQQPVLVGDTELPPGTTTKHAGGGFYEVFFNGERKGFLKPGGPNGQFINDTGWDVNAGFEQAAQAQRAQGQPGAGTTPAGPDMGAFIESPDYQFNVSETQKAVDRSAAARTGVLSGRAVKEGQRYASGLASGEFNNFTQRLLQIAGLGSAGVTTSANAGMTSAGQIGAAQINAGNTRASAYMTGAQGVNNSVQGGVSNLLLMRYLNQTPVQPAPGGG